MKPFAISLLLILSSLITPLMYGADSNLYPITTGDKAFYDQIKKAILANDFESFAKSVAYPIEINTSNKAVRVQTKYQLKEYQSLIFNRHLKHALQKHSADSLFKNWQGVMIGDGDIWFSRIEARSGTRSDPSSGYRITAINPMGE